MHIHTVYFWLKDDVTVAQRQSFEEGLQSLLEIDSVAGGSFGKPIASPREVVDDTFNYGLHVEFKTTVDHDHYQMHDIHNVFIGAHKDKWACVQVFDTLV